MVNQDGAAKFLELENSASQLLDELDRLREEMKHYGQASASLDAAQAGLTGLTSAVAVAAEQLQSLVTGLRDVGMPELLDRMNAIEDQLSEARSRLDESTKDAQKDFAEVGKHLTSLIEFHSKGFWGKLFGKPRRADGSS